jgi:ParB-like chromosome segregation protein Spo0J
VEALNSVLGYYQLTTEASDCYLESMAKGAKASPPANIDIEIQRWPIERLKPYEGNARTHSNAQINQIAASMKEFGWTNPIIVDADDGVIAGHARLLAAQKLGMKEVPVIVLAHLSEAQRRALIIADNQLALNAGWDEELLRVELAILHEGDYDLDLPGFDDVELARLLAAQEAYPGLADEDAVLEPPANPISKTGDLFLLGDHRLICGDCTDPKVVARLLAGANPMITSPACLA